ncbi:MAG: hypothetical protein ACR2QW_02465 [bacterium]
MIRLILFGGLAVLLFFFFRWLSHQPRSVYWQSIAGLVAITLLLLVVTGRAHWLAAVFAALLPFLRTLLALLNHIPLLKRVLDSTKSAQSSTESSGGQTSTVQSYYIYMTLYHDSGEINGEVLVGQFKGRTLDQLELEELLELLHECQDDDESVALLQAYLDRTYEDSWRQHAGEQGQQQTSSEPGKMSHEEALQILGLSPNPSEEEIIQAHRRLMQNLHPDRGGSAYLAAKINLAKETLLAT